MNRIQNKRGSALIIVLMVVLLLMILFSMVILYGSYHTKLVAQDINESKAFYAAESGIQAALAYINSNNEKSFILTDTVGVSGRFNTEVVPYGAYLLCISTGESGSREKTIRCLIGCKNEGKFNNVLNLGGQDYPLMLAGKTKIIGNVLVSPAGVLPGKFKGQGFSGDKLVEGEIVQSALRRLPEYDTTTIHNFINCYDNKSYVEATTFGSTLIVVDENKEQLALDSMYLFESDLFINLESQVLNLTGKTLKIKGNLRIGNTTKVIGFGVLDIDNDIKIDNNSLVNDVILISRKNTLIKDNAKFGGQLITYGKTEIVESAALVGNSVVIAIGNRGDNDKCIYLSCSTENFGTIISDTKEDGITHPGESSVSKSIQLSENCMFNGVIYNTGYSKISGTIEGNLSTNYLYLYDAPTVYIDWLINSTLTKSDRLTFIPALFNPESKYVISAEI